MGSNMKFNKETNIVEPSMEPNMYPKCKETRMLDSHMRYAHTVKPTWFYNIEPNMKPSFE